MKSSVSALLFLTFLWGGVVLGEPKKEKKSKLTVPIPVGHGASGIKIPCFDENGKLQMNFQIEAAERIDEKQLQMKALKLETFDEGGRQEMTVELPSSILDLTTRIISSSTTVFIRRSDFELSGESMRFNTVSRQGELTGKVKMLIYNLNEMSEPRRK